MKKPNQPPLPLLLVFAYLGFIAYGSLVPLQYTPIPFELAWTKFQQAKMLQLGVDSRADWIANGILYIPAGFLVAEWLTGHVSRAFRILVMMLAFAVCAALAFGIEFTQIFFPPRTVSQNDVLAECIGSLFGIILAPFLGHWLRQLIGYRSASHSACITLVLSAYLLAYLAYSLFPYNFLISSSELSAKFNSNQWGILFAGSETGGRLFLTIVKLGIEVAAAIPFGIFLIRRSRNLDPSPVATVLPGALLGMFIEIAQLFMYTGSSQGISVATRTLGSYAGAMLWLHGRHIDESTLKALLKRSTWVLLPVYLLGVAGLTGWFSQRWGSFEAALVSLEKTKWLPFYYHYYTSEARALTSLISVIAMFAPLGLFTWAWNWSRLSAALLAVLLAFIVEASRLFFADTHPDPTNLLLAGASTWLVALLASKLHAPIAIQSPLDDIHLSSTETTAPHNAPHTSRNGGHLILLVLVAGLSAYWLTQFPVQPILLAIALLVCALLAWFKPIAVMALVPAALPVLDLAPWSGRFFLDEFDILLLATLSIGYVRTNNEATPAGSDKLLNLTLCLLLLSFAISTLRTLLPLPTIDANSFSSYFSQFNSLRIIKGLIWAFAFIGLYRRLAYQTESAFKWFAWGICLGLAVTVSIIIREKALFGGLFNFSSDYRATGPFAAIHTGGAFIECYLAVASPFLILLTAKASNWLKRTAGSTLLLATTYALMVTVSRNGFAAYSIACGGALLATLSGTGSKWRRFGIVAILGGAMLAVAIPMFKGDFTQQRMSQVGNDLGVRTAHWRDGLAMRQDDWLTDLFGMGVGRYPATHYWSSREHIHASQHSLGSEENNTYLRIAPGNTLYVEQIVGVTPQQHYRLKLNFRSSLPQGTAGIALCEKWMLASAQCATWQRTPPAKEPNVWYALQFDIDSKEMGSGLWFSQRPIKLSFFTNGTSIIDVDNIQLTRIDTADELIRNGDFSQNMDRWYFATDEHLAWHIKSMPMAILFDQGWFGIIAFGVFITSGIITTFQRLLQGCMESGIFFAATMSFLIVGIFDTLIDAPRFLFLLTITNSLGQINGHKKPV